MSSAAADISTRLEMTRAVQRASEAITRAKAVYDAAQTEEDRLKRLYEARRVPFSEYEAAANARFAAWEPYKAALDAGERALNASRASRGLESVAWDDELPINSKVS